MKTEKLMFELEMVFQRELFQRVVEKYGGSIKASIFLGIPPSSIRGYKNLYARSIPESLLKTLINQNITNWQEINKKTKSLFYNNEKIFRNLGKGREKIRERYLNIRQEIPSLGELIQSDNLDFFKWVKKYRFLSETSFRKISLIEKKDYLLINYPNFSQSKFKNFSLKFPYNFKLGNDFIYFLGLWCGDKSGGKRIGICNQNPQINSFVESFLKNIFQVVEKILYLKEGLLEPKVEYHKKYFIKNGLGWTLSTHSNNGILSSFFYYLELNLDYFLKSINDKNVFFAGLFDAEGNVSLYNNSFRWACKNPEMLNIHSKYLEEIGLMNKYDGSSLVTYNRDVFSSEILPYLKNKDKINLTYFLCEGRGVPPKEYIDVLSQIFCKPGHTQKQISKGLKRSKVYSELRKLKEFGFISYEGYPHNFRITLKGRKLLEKLKL